MRAAGNTLIIVDKCILILQGVLIKINSFLIRDLSHGARHNIHIYCSLKVVIRKCLIIVFMTDIIKKYRVG